MNTYILFSLLTEFKGNALWHIQSLWLGWMDLEEATDDQTRFAAIQRALCRIRVLRRAAGALNAHHAQACGQALESRLASLTHAPVAARPEAFEALYQATNELAEALSTIDREPSISEDAGQPTEAAFTGGLRPLKETGCLNLYETSLDSRRTRHHRAGRGGLHRH